MKHFEKVLEVLTQHFEKYGESVEIDLVEKPDTQEFIAFLRKNGVNTSIKLIKKLDDVKDAGYRLRQFLFRSALCHVKLFFQ